ncbi:MAG: glycosyltransferase [Ilumatobacteraceae bacterium]
MPAVAQAVALATVVARLARRPATPTLAVPAPDLATEPISIVIPARNEVGRLGPCLDALRGAPGVAEVIVVDDESTDGTATLARSLGAEVQAGVPLPEGWAGKAWALWQGVVAANHEVIVTFDADTRPDPGLPTRLRERLAAGADLVTVAGSFETPTRPMAILHPALLTTLVYRFGRPGPADPRRRILANGQCMAIRRSVALDGALDAVRGELVEDVALARHLASAGRRVEFVDAADGLRVQMFESARDTWSGWGRSLALPGVDGLARQLTDLAVLGLVQGLPVIRTAGRLIAGRRPSPFDLAALAIRVGTLAGTRRAYPDAGAWYWASPVADPAAVVRLGWSIARPSRSWRGRTYPTA